MEQKQPASSNENNVPAKKNHDTTLSLDETKSENTPAKNPSGNDKASEQKSNKTAKPKHRTIVCGDSMVKNVDSWKLKPKCHKNEEIVIKSFPGATVKDMQSYIEPSVDRKPDTIILHCGTNDLRFKDKTEVQISGEIIEVAKLIQSNEIDVKMKFGGLRVQPPENFLRATPIFLSETPIFSQKSSSLHHICFCFCVHFSNRNLWNEGAIHNKC